MMNTLTRTATLVVLLFSYGVMISYGLKEKIANPRSLKNLRKLHGTI